MNIALVFAGVFFAMTNGFLSHGNDIHLYQSPDNLFTKETEYLVLI